MPDIRDVPCASCAVGYNLQHHCEVPYYCPCDRAHLHSDLDPSVLTPVAFYGGRLHGTRLHLQFPSSVPPPFLAVGPEIYARLDDPDTGEWLGAYVHIYHPDTLQDPNHAEDDIHREVPGRVPLLWGVRRWLRGLLRHG